jgi:carboxyl-terminal processing protease
MEALVLDLRNNFGGLLEAAITTCDLFVEHGRIVSTQGRSVEPEISVASESARYTTVPMTVLVNRYTASASEIVAACLQDHKRATIVGERSFGKGTVQNVIPLEGGKSNLKLTVATYHRPSGKNIHRFKESTDKDEWGVTPDDGFEIKLTDDELRRLMESRHQRDMAARPDAKKPQTSAAPRFDPQLDKAIERVRKK